MAGMEVTAPTDVVRRFYGAFSERDLPAVLDTLDPGIVFEPVLGVLYSQHSYRGYDGMSRWFAELASEWDSFEMIVEKALETGDGVVAFLHMIARRGEQELEADIAVECGFRDGRISSFMGRDAWEVAEELGVAPPAGPPR
jgi:ketosteroid isomerase-like protein